MATLQIKLSLSSWEKQLIRETKEGFSEELGTFSSQESPVTHDWIRENWGWATQVRDELRWSFHDMDDEEKAIHQSDPDRTWQVLQSKLSSRSQSGTSLDSYSCYTRTRLLLDANDSLRSFICQQQLPCVAPDCIQLTEDDGKDWQAIWTFSKFIKTNHPRLHNLQCPIDTLIWKTAVLVPSSPPLDDDKQSYTSHAENQESSEASEQGIMCEYPAFEVHSMVQTVASYYRQSQVDFPRELGSLHGEPGSFIDELEYIPIAELRTEGDLAQNPVASWLPKKTCPLDHHLFTEEEVFKYCVEAKFEFPGYRDQDGIIFVATELDKNELCKARWDLPVLWNDCGLTFDTATNRTYLLQTRPGIKFRELQNLFSLDAARKYFRSITDAVRLNRPESLDSILHVMQLQNSDLKIYDGLVEVIPFHEISFSGETDDTGHSGAILFAGWHVPQEARLQNPESEVIPVALKQIWRPGDPYPELLQRELANTIVTFTDASVASIRLDGLTFNPESKEIFLVFEKANGVQPFLDKALDNSGKDWDLILGLFMDAAGSLEVIHQRGHLHRDIHIGNVLIHDVPCPNEEFDSEYTELVIIDLGQGQDMANPAWLSTSMYGSPDYWAPEVDSDRQYSEKSDVFAVGYMMAEILRIRCEKAADDQIPKLLWDLVARCLEKDPDLRPTAGELAVQAQKLRDDFFVVPERRSAAVRGEVILGGSLVDFWPLFSKWSEDRYKKDKGKDNDIIPRF